jgi:aminopeptidase
MGYVPERAILEGYARLMIEFALGGGAGIKPGDVVAVTGSDACKPLYIETCRAVWRAGGHVIDHYSPSSDESGDLRRSFYELASEEQLSFLPAAYHRGKVDQIDHTVSIDAPSDLRSLDGIDPSRQMLHRQSMLPVLEWEQEKENQGRFSWTVALYGTEALAAEARMSIEEYWEQIIKACFLEDSDPVARWRKVRAQIKTHRDRLHIEGAESDLWLTLGEKRQWRDGVGANLPSFEIFTSPDWRGTEGWIRFSEPLYAFGSLIHGVELEFEQGKVVKARAAQNEHLLQEMIATDNADRIGEFSLTDARLSPITRFMAETLYDENIGGPFGNTHIALGDAYKDTYSGNPADLSTDDWERLGFNHSAIHTDIVSTSDRTVTARLSDGSERLIYADGQFQLDDIDV